MFRRRCAGYNRGDAPADGVNIDYDGASGPLEFTDVGEPGAGIYGLFKFNTIGGYDVFAQVTIECP